MAYANKLDKNHIFYSAIETVDKSQLEMFSKELLKGSELENYIDSFKSWEEAFKFLADKSKKERILIIIDEFPYMVNGNSSIPSILQNIWDLNLKNSKTTDMASTVLKSSSSHSI